ncbi:hypothetical protein V5P93_007026 [Actinokineospora auranticolor]|uniref:4-amino-4-deoxy-L-arabinose transferase-like glycosyltransferase n=1 Tax=Actinokineospora auranticolor TaxID=155976 RepID=A0A2S6GH42_9PSEU|nr:hypothetical protein [Actinokineospora auranticolor]PPK64520.1 hypothetical protein CLV40_11987 [Actinokineospora auranticolor]
MRTSARPTPAPGRPAAVAGAAGRPRVWLTATLVAAVIAIIRLAMVVFSDYPRAVGLFDDDAFYYFGVAGHIAAGDGSTFNGLDPTNGYHPLWLLLLVPVFSITNGKAALVAVTLVSSVLAIASGRQIDRIGTITGRPVLVTLCAAPLLVVGAAGPSFWYSGMETGVLLFGLLWLAAIYLRTDGFTAPGFGTTQARAVGALIAIAVLARLDTVFPVAVLAVVAIATWVRAGKPWLRLTLSMATFPVLALAAYLVVNQLLFNTPLPVSGQAKALGGGGFNTDTIGQFLTSPVLFGQSTWLGTVALVVVVGALLARATGGLGHAARFGGVVLAGGVLTVGYYAFTSSWQLWPWYFSSAPLAIALAGPALLSRWADRVPARAVLAGAGVVVLVAAVAFNGVRSTTKTVARSAFIEAGPAVAAQIDALVPGEEPIAMGDRAGSLGYHLRRPVVHLEGLVNSAEYLDALKNGTVHEFLARRGVALYARGDNDPGKPDPANPGCERFVEPQQGGGTKVNIVVCEKDLLLSTPVSDGTSYRVWRYRTNLNR